MELFPVLITIFAVFLVLLLLYLLISYTVFYMSKRKNKQKDFPHTQQGGHIYIPRKKEQINQKDLSQILPQTKNKITIIKSLDKNR